MPLDRRSRQSFDAHVDRRGQRGRSCLRGSEAMALFVKVARLEDLPPGTGMMVVGPFDKPMALFNVGGEVFAINAVCPHRGARSRTAGSTVISSRARGMAGPSMSGPASPIMVADTA